MISDDRAVHTLDCWLAQAIDQVFAVRRVRPRISCRSQRFVYSTLVAERGEHNALRSPQLSPTVRLAWPFRFHLTANLRLFLSLLLHQRHACFESCSAVLLSPLLPLSAPPPPPYPFDPPRFSSS